jgi:hypothetical protein
MEKTSTIKQASVFLFVTLIIIVSPSIALANTNTNDIYINTIRSSGSSIGAPNLTVEDFKGGIGISAVVKNVGDAPATNVSWSINITGKFIFYGAHSTGHIASLAPGNSTKIYNTAALLGLGKIYINTTATCAEGATYTEEGTAIMLLFFALGVKEPLP